MSTVPLSNATQVLQCGGVVTYQLLCGREIARGDEHARQSANYCYLIVNTHDHTAVAVDAAWDVDGVYALAAQLQVRIRGCIYTHCHTDHCGGDAGPAARLFGRQYVPGAREVQEQGGLIWAGRGDVQRIEGQCKMGGITALDDGDVLECGDLLLHTIHTPGHSPGSICIFAAPRCLSPRGNLSGSPLQNVEIVTADGGLLLTGDTLFVGSCGRTDMPNSGMDPDHMMASLSRLSTMSSSVIVLPGHNYASVPFTTIGMERATNLSVRASIERMPRPPSLPVCVACGIGEACGPSGFVIGRRVRITGLQSEAGQALNGQDGAVQGFSADKGRYMVKLLAASEAKVIKPDNLEACSTETAELPVKRDDTNLALGCVATASSSKSGERAPSNVVDGRLDTRWTSEYADEQWLSVDLCTLHIVTVVKIRWEVAHARSYQLQSSVDGGTWITLASEHGRQGWVVTELPEATRCRWVRMYGETRATSFGFSIWEFKVYGVREAE